MCQREITIELPIPLPTWNRLLAMHPWERKKCRDMIHSFVGKVVRGENISQLELEKYDRLIRPKKVQKVRKNITSV